MWIEELDEFLEYYISNRLGECVDLDEDPVAVKKSKGVKRKSTSEAKLSTETKSKTTSKQAKTTQPVIIDLF